MKAPAQPLSDRLMCRERPVHDISDSDLLAEAQRDPSEFVALYDRYFPRVYGYVRLRVRDEATCEDITSQVFLNALARVQTFRAGGNVGAWLFTIAQNAVRDVYRRQERILHGEDILRSLSDPEPSPEEQVLDTERATDLRTLLATLRPDQQDLLALRYGAGLSFPEIARIAGKNSVAVRVSVHRILADLRRRYSYEG